LTKVVLSGTGKMGNVVKELLDEASDFEVVGQVGIENKGDLKTLPTADLVMDFSHPGMLPGIIGYTKRTQADVLCGTTGLTDADIDQLKSLSDKVAVLWSGNFSLGIAVLRRMCEEVGKYLGDWDEEIVEIHHNQKQDAPSGTALMLAHALDPKGEKHLVYGREGMVGLRPKDEIGIHSLRGGTVAGTHEVYFFGTDEELTLTHRASSRVIFAEGALTAARKLVDKKLGWYTFDSLIFGENRK